MDKEKKYNLFFIFWAIISTILLGYMFYNQEIISDNSVEILNHKIDSIMVENSKLDSAIYSERKKSLKFETYIDSLEHLKPKIVTKYVNKYKEIDSASVAVVVSQFDSIFAKNSIK